MNQIYIFGETMIYNLSLNLDCLERLLITRLCSLLIFLMFYLMILQNLTKVADTSFC
jgi:hypothetical protein